MNDYEAKLEARRERYAALAEKNNAAAEGAYRAFRRALDPIPPGQPILVGHYSERGHRAALRRADNAMRRVVEAQEKAKYYEQRAASVGSAGISSDDPDAIDKLKQKLENMQKSQEIMKAANKIVKAKKLSDAEKIEKLEAMGLQDPGRLLVPDFCGRVGFADYRLKNNNANMRRVAGRIAELEARAEAPEVAPQEYEGFEVLREDNRIQIVFPGKPASEVRNVLKRNAFKWSPSRGAWVRQLNNAGEYVLQCVIEKIQ